MERNFTASVQYNDYKGTSVIFKVVVAFYIMQLVFFHPPRALDLALPTQ